MIWLHCSLPSGHNQLTYGHPDFMLDDHIMHFDSRRGIEWNGGTVYEGEFPVGRVTNAGAVPKKRKITLCKKCGKHVRSDGANDACVCKVTGNTKSQAILFAEERAKKANLDDGAAIQRDIDWIEGQLQAQWDRFIDEECESYRGDF